ncbi:LysR family transcriptional regulator [Swingsia samuiensis]|uniref:LysR family transcriptional regulator n=1 Tax=Swingsia samuiensis TaxID=1293412 RepID=A0A4Y6UMV1_9PROT|nr:LysR family transcriptional regulator [Swingsia samuiensis]QDH17998.1 LysR family transcriptional regulator [Swingsia samuiensis]
MRLPDFEAWAIFAKVAERGSFARAAEDIKLSKPTVSKAVTRLEQTLGISLFNRNSRQMSLTETGRHVLEHANRIIAEAEAAEAEAKGSILQPAGMVRIAAPMTFSLQHIAPILPKFLKQYPHIDISLDLSDTVIDLVANGVDLAIRIASLSDSALRARHLCPVKLLLVASPAWLDQNGRPSHPSELAPKKAFVYTNGHSPGIIKMRHIKTKEDYTFYQSSRLQTNNAEAVLPALYAQLGFGLFPEFMIGEKLKSGELEQILPEWEVPSIGIYIVTPPSPLRPARVSAFTDFLIKEFENPPWVQK